MKKLMLFSFLFIGILNLKAQDTILLRNGEEIKAKISAYSDDEVMYKLFDNPTGATLILNKKAIFLIKKADGSKEFLKVANKPPEPKQVEQPIGFDLLILRSGEEIKATIIANTDDEVMYKLFNDPSSTNIIIDKQEIFMIKKKDGTEEIIKKIIVNETSSFIESNDVSNESDSREFKDRYFSYNKNKYSSFSLGYGQSYGGLGVRYQRRWGNKVGLGVHAGGGYMPSPESSGGPTYFFSGGFKFFWYKGWYFDFQYGPTSTFKRNNYQTSWKDERGKTFGPSILIGGDWFFNKYVGLNGGLGVATNITESDYPTSFPTLDFGFIVKF